MLLFSFVPSVRHSGRDDTPTASTLHGFVAVRLAMIASLVGIGRDNLSKTVRNHPNHASCMVPQ